MKMALFKKYNLAPVPLLNPDEQVNKSVARKVCATLDLGIKAVERTVKKCVLGEIYSVYRLLFEQRKSVSAF
jgi:hypothetical protein